MDLKLDHINLTVKNISESMEWYKKAFGFEILEGNVQHPDEPWAIIGKNDSMICMYEDKKLKLASEAGEGEFHRIYHFGIRISDKSKWDENVRKNGIQVMYGGAHQYPNSVSWYVVDPSGHEIEVSYSGGEALKFGR